MAESIFLRVRRVMSANVEDMVDQLERTNSPATMREAVREIDRAVDEVRGDYENAVARRMQAQRQQRMLRERAATLTDKAKFAVEGGRDDLAEAALTRQIDFEAQADKLEQVITASDDEAKRLEELTTALNERKSLMEDELRAFEQARADASFTGPEGGSQGKREIEARVARAEAAFNRAMDGTGVGGVSRADAKTASAVAELDGLHKSSLVKDRLEALRKAA